MILNHRGQPVEFPRLGFRPSAPTHARRRADVATVVAKQAGSEPDAQLVDAVGYWTFETPEMVAETE